MMKILFGVIAIMIIMYLIMEIIIHYFEVPVLIFRAKQFTAYAISFCFAWEAAITHEVKVLLWFFVAMTVYWLIKSLLDRSEFYYWIEMAENAIKEQAEAKKKEEE